MAEGLTFDVAANDKASATLDKVDSKVGNLGDSASRWESSLQKVNTSNRTAGASMVSLGTKVGVAGAAIGGAVMGAKQLYGAMSEAEQVANEYEKSLADVQLAIQNTGISQAEAAEQAANTNQQIRDLADEAGMRIPRVANAAEQLTFRLGDASQASDNLRRLLGLMARTGEGAEQVGKDLAEALDGDINAMKELGILSDSQVQRFNEISDRGERTNRVLEIMDQKLAGVVEQNKATQSSGERVSKAFERMKAAIGSTAVIEAPLDGVATIIEGIATEVEGVAAVWDEKTPGIKARIMEIEQATGRAADKTRQLKENIEQAGEAGEQFDKRQRAIENINQKYDTQLWQLDQIIAKNADVSEGDTIVALKRQQINDQREKELALVDKRLPKDFKAASVTERELEIQELRVQALETEDEIRAAKLEKQARVLEIQSKIQELMEKQEEGVNVENEIQRANLEMRKAQAQFEQRVADARERNTAAAEDEAEQVEIIGMTANERLELEQRITQEYHDRFAATDREVKALRDSVKASEDQADALMSGFQARAKSLEEQRKIREEMEAEEAAIKARVQSQRIGRAGAAFSGAGQAAGGATALLEQATVANEVAEDATEAEQRRYEQIRRTNEELAKQINQYSDLSGVIGEVGGGIAELASVQWDFSKAGDASLSALNALSTAGKATAGILGKNTKQQAGIQAGFEAAAAAGALGLALTTQQPQFYAAAAQHTAAAGLYGAVAGGAGAGTGTAVGGAGGGGGSGGGSNRPQLDVDAEREKTIKGFAEALKEDREARQIVNNNYFGAGSMIADAPSVGREVNRIAIEAQSATMTRTDGGS